jgi:hypothetical protein
MPDSASEPLFSSRWRRARFLVRHPRWLWRATINRWHGYKFGPIERHRCCDHTTPAHYRWCRHA